MEEREGKLLYECGLEDLIEELKARYPTGCIIAVLNKPSDFTIRTHGYLGALDELSVRTRALVIEQMEGG